MTPTCGFKGVPELSALIRTSYACRNEGEWRNDVPIVYCKEYNVRAFGIEKLHPFDACKFEKIANRLEKEGLCSIKDFRSPIPITKDELLDVHGEGYLKKLQSSPLFVAQVAELPLILFFPNFMVQRCIIKANFFHTSGTMLAMALAIERGWAINLGGGAHHARHDFGEGWCFLADAMLGIRKIRSVTENRIQKVIYIDCDVHQGNGVERDKLHFQDTDLFILDVYNSEIWPGDSTAKKAIDIKVEVSCGTRDAKYLAALEKALQEAKERFKPDLIVYNAGTDILINDPLGRLKVTPEGVIKREEMIFQYALDVDAPIVMLLSGGYTRTTHVVIADSILHLSKKFHLLGS